ncbi:hypothetical protein AB0M47_08695 [Hamadaea sp. NPDC051192]|uniref:hypothetical protein n=1 Tax=Hamadaea sp. NPDC051192 TaxID=3154940 RepID=UPI003440ED99
MPRPMRRYQPSILAELQRESAERCAAGRLAFGGWKTGEDGHHYWDCLNCDYRHVWPEPAPRLDDV